MINPLFIPESVTGQVNELYRMFYDGNEPPASPVERFLGHVERIAAEEGLGLRIIEDAAPVNPLATTLAIERAAYRNLQWNVCRGLVLGFTALLGTGLVAVAEHDWLVVAMVSILMLCCPSLYLMTKKGSVA